MIPGFVLDTSATMPWCFADEATADTDRLLLRLREGTVAIVPAHWPTEVMNVLLMAQRRGRIAPELVTRFAGDLASLPILIEPPMDPTAWKALIHVAQSHRLTAYDAAYLALAIRLSIPLATLDQDLRSAATRVGVRLELP